MIVACGTASSVATAQGTDQGPTETFYTSRDGAIAAGFLVASAGLSVFDARISRYFQDSSLYHVRLGRRWDDVFTHLNETTLTVGGLAVYVVARVVKARTVADVALHTAESVAAASLTAQVIRGPLGRTRPQKTDVAHRDQYDFHFMKGFSRFENRAFPSIHSSSGFAAASAIVAEVRRRNSSAAWAVGVPAYAIALTPGLSRMYLGQHWASDIFAGAFLGTFYGWRVVEYSHSHPTTPVDRVFLGNADRQHAGPPGFSIGWSGKF